MPKGVYQRESGRHAANFRDLSGQRFGKRIVLSWNSSPIYRGKKGSSLWDVLCDCGKRSVVTTSALKSSTSCGCDLAYTELSGKARRSLVPAKIRANHGHRKAFFHLSPEQFQERIEGQNNRCAVCGTEFVRTPHVDHNHSCCSGQKTCGKCVRGLLCHQCNCGLGNFHDDPDLMQKAIDYLRRYAIQQSNKLAIR